MLNKLRIYGGGSVMGILIFILLFPTMAFAATLMLPDGIHVGMPSYVNPVRKDDGSVCVSSGKRELDLTICMVGVKFLSAAEERGFFRYDEIPEDGKNQVGGVAEISWFMQMVHGHIRPVTISQDTLIYLKLMTFFVRLVIQRRRIHAMRLHFNQ